MMPLPRSIRLAALTLLCAAPAAWAQAPDFLLGSPMPPSQAERSIAIGPDTRWANVKQGESIRFVAGQVDFGWRFDGRVPSFDLMRVAPAGFVNRPFTVYVAPSHQGRSAN